MSEEKEKQSKERKPVRHIRDVTSAPFSPSSPSDSSLIEVAACKAKLEEGDSLVDAAMQSDCDDCRSARMIGPTKEPNCQAKPAFDEGSYEPEPYPNLESLEEIRARRDGR